MADHVGEKAIGYLLVASGSQRKREESLRRLSRADLEWLAAMIPEQPSSVCWGVISVVERLDLRTPEGLNRLNIGNRKQSTERVSLGERHV